MELAKFGSQICHVDLSQETVESKAAPEEWVQQYIGGRGLGVRYVLEAGASVDPLGCLLYTSDAADE